MAEKTAVKANSTLSQKVVDTKKTSQNATLSKETSQKAMPVAKMTTKPQKAEIISQVSPVKTKESV